MKTTGNQKQPVPKRAPRSPQAAEFNKPPIVAKGGETKKKFILKPGLANRRGTHSPEPQLPHSSKGTKVNSPKASTAHLGVKKLSHVSPANKNHNQILSQLWKTK